VDTFKGLYELSTGREFSIPLTEVTVFIIFISLCLLLGRHRLGLLTTYCFVFYWGFISNMNKFVDMLSSVSWGVPLYVFSGFLMFIVAVVGFWLDSRA
jgi:hypothetical protein